MEPDTTIIAGASSWRGTFTQCGGIPRMMAGSVMVAVEQVGANNIKQPAWWWSAHNKIREEVSFLLAFFNNTKQQTMRQLCFARGGLGGV